MYLPEKQLFIKRSKIPGSGQGLFTKKSIAKGTRIVEYKGRITTWKTITQADIFNGYVFYITRNYVIDAMPFKKHLGRYANDARGITKVKGFTNNAKYVIENKKVFIEAIKGIEAGEEIFVSYGKEYWQVIRYNNKLEGKGK